MARSHRFMQAATLNSLVRALAPSSAARALRMVSFMTTLRLPTYHATSIALIGACARQHLSAEASDLYWWGGPLLSLPTAVLNLCIALQAIITFRSSWQMHVLHMLKQEWQQVLKAMSGCQTVSMCVQAAAKGRRACHKKRWL